MNRDDVISRLTSIAPAIRAFGATAIYLFGSTARNEATPSSDVDIFFEYDASHPFGLIKIAQMERMIENTLGAKVDLTTRDSLHPILRADIEQSAIRVL